MSTEKPKEKKKTTSAFMKPVYISSSLAEIVGKGPMPRTEVTQKLWAYIKEQDLQDKSNKRNINPDQKLAKVLGSTKQINMFELTREIAKHLKNESAAAASL